MVGLPENQAVSHRTGDLGQHIATPQRVSPAAPLPRQPRGFSELQLPCTHRSRCAVPLSCAGVRITEPDTNSSFSWKQKAMQAKRMSRSRQRLARLGVPTGSQRGAAAGRACDAQPLTRRGPGWFAGIPRPAAARTTASHQRSLGKAHAEKHRGVRGRWVGGRKREQRPSSRKMRSYWRESSGGLQGW